MTFTTVTLSVLAALGAAAAILLILRARVPKSSRRRGRGGARGRSRSRRRAHRNRTARRRGSRAGLAPPAKTLAIAAAAVAALCLTGYVTGAFKDVPEETSSVALRIVFNAKTAEDAEASLPEELRARLRETGLSHGSIALTRVDSTGTVDTKVIDMTARVDDKPNSPALIPERAIPAINARIASLERTINASKATTGGRSLFNGLARVDFTGVPVYIISSGLDLEDPLSFPKLNWSTPPQQVVDNIKTAGELPRLHGPVTFIVTPTAGSQDQLRAKHADYRNEVWRSTLTASGATSVNFIEAVQTGPAGGPKSPPVKLSEVPDTPIVPVKSPTNPKRATCTLPTAFFVVNTPRLLDEGATISALRPCIEEALAANASFELDGWTSYEGPLDAAGRPAVDDPGNRSLSAARVRTISELLIQHFGVATSQITATRAHGNTDQPDPDPRSPANRRVDVTFTTP